MVSAVSVEARLVARVPASLSDALDAPVRRARRLSGMADVDMVLSAAGKTFAVDVKTRAPALAANVEPIARAARKLGSSVVPVLAVPFMTDAGRRACNAARVSWLDLSGNAHIVAPGLRVILDGRPNLFRTRGRPASVFAPKSARVVRWLLVSPERAFTQREIAHGTGMSEGFVSRIVARLESDGFVDRVGVDSEGDGTGSGYGFGHADGSGSGFGDGGYGGGDVDGGGRGDGWRGTGRGKRPIRVRNADVLLDAWRDEYEFAKHTILRGHVAARSGDALTHFAGDQFAARKIEHAATGLSAAWQLTHFAAFRIATFYVATEPAGDVLKHLGFREEPRGANLWLVIPNDAGVFLGAQMREGVRCVHPVQAYMDLKAHPERAAEAAERLRSDFLQRPTDA